MVLKNNRLRINQINQIRLDKGAPFISEVNSQKYLSNLEEYLYTTITDNDDTRLATNLLLTSSLITNTILQQVAVEDYSTLNKVFYQNRINKDSSSAPSLFEVIQSQYNPEIFGSEYYAEYWDGNNTELEGKKNFNDLLQKLEAI